MRKTCWFLTGLVVATACKTTTEPYADLRVETSVGTFTVLGAPLGITTTVTNESSRPVTIYAGTCPVHFRVESSTGSTIPLPIQTCAAIKITVTLVPGGIHRFTDQWDGRDRNGTRITGTYLIIGQPFSDSGPQSAPVTVQLPQN
ncbi:MAG: hypothetical protein H7Z40_18945 [Phycisphaerae bacterium]|nr:hypothetical protein [Gemmatimonadaceae bacterium]